MPPSTPVTVSQALALALQYQQTGRLAEAEALYRRILAVQPGHAEALHRLGVAALQAGRYEAAAESIRLSLAQNPGNASAHSNLGEACRAMGDWDGAIACYRRALELKPDSPEIHNNLGLALTGQGQMAEAIRALRQALQWKPDYAEAHNNLGNALSELQQLDEAIAAYEAALRFQPGLALAWNNLGIALAGRGRFEEAIAAWRRALQLQPNYPEALNSLGSTWTDLGQLDEAVTALHRALQLRPGYGEARYNLGNVLRLQGRLDEAAKAFREAIRLQPAHVESYNNLGNVLTLQGRLDEAIATYCTALKWDPDAAWVRSNLICTLNFHPGTDAAASAKEQAGWSQRFAEPLKQFIVPHANDRNPGRRLRVGYVSPDFCLHVVGVVLAPLFRAHDHCPFEFFCYSGVARPDEMTAEFRRLADHWRDTVGVNDETLATMIRQDGIDILVDLSFHNAGNRLPVFARQPAPVQVSFLGYTESTGLDAIGYLISDRYLESKIEDRSSEFGTDLRSPNSDLRPAPQVCLIESFLCFDSRSADTPVNALPALQTGYVTFGCLNNFAKINETVIEAWAEILRGVDGSRLLLFSHEGSHRANALEAFTERGVKPGRVRFVSPCPRRELLELYHQIDIALDPFPFNGHATSLDAFWMGVPVVSLIGNRPVARGGFSILSNLALNELFTYSIDVYISTAKHFANDVMYLSQLRSTMRSRMETSPLMDPARLARGVESAYRTMWRRYCANPVPHPL